MYIILFARVRVVVVVVGGVRGGRGPGVSSLLSNHGLRVIREYVTANRIGLIMHVCVCCLFV